MSFTSALRISQESKYFLQGLRQSSAQEIQLVSICIGRAVNDRLSVPSSAVEDPASYYDSQCREIAMQLINAINEVTIIDARQALETTRSLWMVRYRVVHPHDRLYCIQDMPFESFMGFNTSVSFDLLKAVRDNGQEAVSQVNGFIGMIDELFPMAADTAVNSAPADPAGNDATVSN